MRLLIVLVIAISFTSCSKEIEKMTVIKDCTGIYLRSKSGIDFKVCNEEDLADFATGTKIKVKYDKLEECFGLLDPPTCSETHSFESKIEVTEIE